MSWQSLKRWWSHWWFVLTAPAPIGKTDQVGVIVEMVPCPELEIESPSGGRSLLHLVENAFANKACNDWVPRVKILAAGTPIYVPSQNRLFIRGKLLKPLTTLVHDEPFSDCCPDRRADGLEHGQPEEKEEANEKDRIVVPPEPAKP